jgi:type II secretory pathway pseudopilin PulG
MKTITILVAMKLDGQAEHGCRREQGYAMAALLVAMSIMAVMMTVVMPVWKQSAQREKETELVFRGMQYVHAIGMFQRKYANAYPPNIDVLVDQKFLRKKFKDPITNEDFVVLPVGQAAPGTAPQAGAGASGQRGTAAAPGAGTTAPGRGQASAPTAPQTGGRGTSAFGTPAAGGTTAGVSGVASKSKDQSIRLYNGRSHYNEWAFVYTPQIQAAGTGGVPGTAAPGQRGRGQPGQPGQQQPSPFGGSGFGNPRGGNPNGPGRGTPGQTSPFGRGGFGSPQTPIQPPPPTPRGRF